MKKKKRKVWYKFVSKTTFLEVLASIFINLASGWFGILLVTPGFLGTSNISDYLRLLTLNLPFGIVGLGFSLWLTEKSKAL